MLLCVASFLPVLHSHTTVVHMQVDRLAGDILGRVLPEGVKL